MEPNQLPDPEITQELWDETPDPSMDGDDFDTSQADQRAATTPEVDDEPAAAPAPEPTPAAPAEPDPYAGLPDAVRNALSAIPAFEQRVKSAEGRVAALQRELAQRPQAPAPEPEAPRKTAIDAIRGELPEVAAAIEEARGQAIDPQQLRQQIAAELQEDMLNDARPTWATDVTNSKFKAWISKQDAAYAEKVNNTSKANVLIAALAKFDADQAAEQKRADAQQGRQRRVAAAVTPNSARRTPATSLDDLSDDEYWDHITK